MRELIQKNKKRLTLNERVSQHYYTKGGNQVSFYSESFDKSGKIAEAFDLAYNRGYSFEKRLAKIEGKLRGIEASSLADDEKSAILGMLGVLSEYTAQREVKGRVKNYSIVTEKIKSLRGKLSDGSLYGNADTAENKVIQLPPIIQNSIPPLISSIPPIISEFESSQNVVPDDKVIELYPEGKSDKKNSRWNKLTNGIAVATTGLLALGVFITGCIPAYAPSKKSSKSNDDLNEREIMLLTGEKELLEKKVANIKEDMSKKLSELKYSESNALYLNDQLGLSRSNSTYLDIQVEKWKSNAASLSAQVESSSSNSVYFNTQFDLSTKTNSALVNEKMEALKDKSEALTEKGKLQSDFTVYKLQTRRKNEELQDKLSARTVESERWKSNSLYSGKQIADMKRTADRNEKERKNLSSNLLALNTKYNFVSSSNEVLRAENAVFANQIALDARIKEIERLHEEMKRQEGVNVDKLLKHPSIQALKKMFPIKYGTVDKENRTLHVESLNYLDDYFGNRLANVQNLATAISSIYTVSDTNVDSNAFQNFVLEAELTKEFADNVEKGYPQPTMWDKASQFARAAEQNNGEVWFSNDAGQLGFAMNEKNISMLRKEKKNGN